MQLDEILAKKLRYSDQQSVKKWQQKEMDKIKKKVTTKKGK